MLILIPLVIDDETKTALESYGKIFRHEIYRIAGIYHKEKRIFAFPYRLVNKNITMQCRRIVVEQAVLYYQTQQSSSNKRLPFVSVWTNEACTLHKPVHRTDPYRLELSCADKKRCVLPLSINDKQAKMLQTGNIIDITITKQAENWTAGIRIQTNANNLNEFNKL